MPVRRNYKDTLFCRLFGTEENKQNALELYNALSGRDYKDLNGLDLLTIDDTIFLGRKNDAAFIIGDELLLLEHQTTKNPNMPLRGLFYLSMLYSKYIDLSHWDVHNTRLVGIPAPAFYVLYFGEDEYPERKVLRLSDAYKQPLSNSCLEIKAIVLNCNEGHNQDIMTACRTLEGYSHIVALERRYRKEDHLSFNDAVARAVNQCIRDGYLVDYLTKIRTEGKEMPLIIEDPERMWRYHVESEMRYAREEGLEQGREQGLEQGLEQGKESALKQARENLLKLGIDQQLIEQALNTI